MKRNRRAGRSRVRRSFKIDMSKEGRRLSRDIRKVMMLLQDSMVATPFDPTNNKILDKTLASMDAAFDLLEEAKRTASRLM
jgi:hypothetical protein